MKGEQESVLERVGFLDGSMLVLAVVSLLIVIAEELVAPYLEVPPAYRDALVLADLAICGVFAVELVARMGRSGRPMAYLRSHWYDAVGLVPVSHPFFRGFRLLRLVRIAVLTSRFVRATNRSFGEMALESAVRRFSDVIVEVVGDAIVLRGIDMVEPWLARARFAERIGEAMHGRRAEIRALVHRNLESSRSGRTALRLPGARALVDAVEQTVADSVVATLASDELNAIVQEATRKVIGELRAQVAVREYAQGREAGGRAQGSAVA